MADKKTNPSGREEDRDEGRQESEQIEQQDLNQGMDTGTHDSTRHGVDWGPSYRGKKGGSQEKSMKQKNAAASTTHKRPDSKP